MNIGNVRIRAVLLSASVVALSLPLVAQAQTRPVPPSTADWYIVLFEQENYRVNPTNYNRSTSNTQKRTVRSVTIGKGRWELCENTNFSGRCVTLDRNVPDLRLLNVRRVSSARPSPDEGRPTPSPEGPYIVLFDETNYRGSPKNFESAVSNTGWNARVQSVTVGRGRWEICEGANFSGFCVFLEQNVPDLSRVGFRGRVVSVRPVVPPR